MESRFITTAKQKFNRYDYSLVDYEGVHTKVKIKCPIHGVFEQTPANHLNGTGCPKCAKINTGNKLRSNIEHFVKQATKEHGHVYDYSLVEYKGVHTKVKIKCPKHGVFEQTPNNHLRGIKSTRGQGCPSCSGVQKKTTDMFILEAAIKYNNKFDYSLVEYINAQAPVTIICPYHGKFNQSPTSHLCSKTGCPICGRELIKGRYTNKTFQYFPELINKPAHLYVVEFASNDERFIKVGISTTDVKYRLQGNTKKYNIKIKVDKQMTLKDAYIQEQNLINKMKSYQYSPNVKFDGHTECFNIEAEPLLIEAISNV